MLRFQNILPVLAFVAVTGTNFSAYAGPCTAQIAQVEQQIVVAGANPVTGPSAPRPLELSLAGNRHRRLFKMPR